MLQKRRRGLCWSWPFGFNSQHICSNNVVILGLSDCRIVRIDLDNPQDLDGMCPTDLHDTFNLHRRLSNFTVLTEIELCRKAGEVIHGMYLDPHGRHLIVSMESG